MIKTHKMIGHASKNYASRGKWNVKKQVLQVAGLALALIVFLKCLIFVCVDCISCPFKLS